MCWSVCEKELRGWYVRSVVRRERNQQSPGDEALSHEPWRMRMETVVLEAGVARAARPVLGAPRHMHHFLHLSTIPLEIPTFFHPGIVIPHLQVKK